MIFDIGGYSKVSAIGLMVVRVSFEVKVKGEHRNWVRFLWMIPSLSWTGSFCVRMYLG